MHSAHLEVDLSGLIAQSKLQRQFRERICRIQANEFRVAGCEAYVVMRTMNPDQWLAKRR